MWAWFAGGTAASVADNFGSIALQFAPVGVGLAPVSIAGAPLGVRGRGGILFPLGARSHDGGERGVRLVPLGACFGECGFKCDAAL